MARTLEREVPESALTNVAMAVAMCGSVSPDMP